MCVAGLVNVSAEAVELGFLIGKPYWKHGYATYGGPKNVTVCVRAAGVETRVCPTVATQRPAAPRSTKAQLRTGTGGDA